MMKRRLIFTTGILVIGALLWALPSGYAAVQPCVQCEIVNSSYTWVYEDMSTWQSQIDNIEIHCYDTCNGNAPVEGYVAEYTGTVNVGTPGNFTPLTNITVSSTPTDSNGDARLAISLLHQQMPDGNYVHLCPFDDINFTQCAPGGALSPKADYFSPVRVISQDSCLGLVGCCEITVTVKCIPPRVFTYCTYSTQAACLAQNYDDPYMNITATWDPNGRCDYCSGHCGPEAITLAQFQAKSGNNSVVLSWETGVELDNAGFNIYRSESTEGSYIKINDSLIPSKAQGVVGASYEYVDTGVANRKTYYYKLEDIDLSGQSTLNGPVESTPRLIFGIMGR